MSRFKEVEFYVNKPNPEYKAAKVLVMEVIDELKDIENGCGIRMQFKSGYLHVEDVVSKIRYLSLGIRNSAVAVEQTQALKGTDYVTEHFIMPTNRNSKNNEEERLIKHLALKLEMEEALLKFSKAFNTLEGEIREILYYSLIRGETYSYLLANRFHFGTDYLFKRKREGVLSLVELLEMNI
jgi:hypothetical protein